MQIAKIPHICKGSLGANRSFLVFQGSGPLTQWSITSFWYTKSLFAAKGHVGHEYQFRESCLLGTSFLNIASRLLMVYIEFARTHFGSG